MPVYIVRAGDHGPVKIGVTQQWNIADRLNVIQTHNHEILQIIRILDGGKALEQALFARFKHQRLHRSWYQFDDAMLGDLDAPDWPHTHLIQWPSSNSEAAKRRWAREKAAA